MKSKVRTITPQFVDDEGHLNDSGISLYVEARLLNKEHKLPKYIKEHVEECAACQMRVMDFYQFMKNETVDIATPHPYLDRKPVQTFIKETISSKYFVGRAAAVVLLLITGYWMLFHNTASQQNTSQAVAYTSPFNGNGLDVKFNAWEMDADKAKVFKLKNGSNIHVPAGAFIDKFGQPVKGKVEIKYREFHNAADIIASGIPMHYDSAGTRHHFESGGMFEIRGNQNGEPVFLANGKNIDVNMVSYNKDKNFNHYYLDESKTQPQPRTNTAQILPDLSFKKAQQRQVAQWKLLGKAKTQPFSSRQADSTNQEQMAAVQRENQPEVLKKKQSALAFKEVPKAVKNAQKIRASEEAIEKTPTKLREKPGNVTTPVSNVGYFKLKFALDFEPELKSFQDVKWSFAGNSGIYNPQNKANDWVLKEPWHKVTLTKLPFGFKTLKAHKQEVMSATYSNNGQYILTHGKDQSASLFDRKGNLVKAFANVKFAQLSKTGKYLLLANGKQVQLWTLDGMTVKTFTQNNEIKLAVLSDNEQFIITTTREEVSKMIDLEGKPVRTFKEDFKYASFSPDGKYMATISDRDFSLKIWTSDGKYLHQLKGEYNTVIFSSDSRHLLTSSDRNAAQLWFFETSYFNTMLMTAFNHRARVNTARFSNDGQKVVTASNDGSAKVWDVSGKLLTTLKVEKYKWVNDAVFSPDNQMVLTAASNGNAQLWDTNTGELKHTLRGHGKSLNGAVFSPDQQGVLTFSKDKTAMIWDRSFASEDIYALDLSNIGPHYEELFKEEMMKFYKREIKVQPVKKQLKKFFTVITMYRPQTLANTTTKPEESQLAKINQQYTKDVANVKIAIAKKREKIDKERRDVAKQEAKLLHNFRVANMGVYNIDRIMQIAGNGRSVIGFNAEVDLGKNYSFFTRFYLITGRNRTGVMRYEPQDLKRFMYSPDLDNQLVVILPKNKVAVFTPEQFKKIDVEKLKKDRQYLFDLTKTHTVHTKQEFEKLLNVAP